MKFYNKKPGCSETTELYNNIAGMKRNSNVMVEIASCIKPMVRNCHFNMTGTETKFPFNVSHDTPNRKLSYRFEHLLEYLKPCSSVFSLLITCYCIVYTKTQTMIHM